MTASAAPAAAIRFTQRDAIIDCTTAGLTDADLRLMDDPHAPQHLALVGDPTAPYGAIFYTGEASERATRAAELAAFGFSATFVARWRAAAEQGAAYIRFDADGAHVLEGDAAIASADASETADVGAALDIAHPVQAQLHALADRMGACFTPADAAAWADELAELLADVRATLRQPVPTGLH